MMVFWILAAGLIGAAMAFVLAPLLRPATPKPAVDAGGLNRALFEQQLAELDADLAAGTLDSARHGAARHDLERQLLDNLDGAPTAPVHPPRSGRWAALVLGVAVPVVAVGLYRTLGEVEIIERLQNPAQAAVQKADHDRGDLPSMEVLVQRLADKLAQNPDNLEGWLMLGRSYAATGQAAQSLSAYRRAYELAPRQPEVLLTYAEALATQNNNQLAGEPERLIATALEIAPQDPNGLWLAGVAALQREDRAGAVRHWEALEALLPPDGDDVANLREFLAEARGEPESPFQPQASTPAAPSQPAAAVAASGATLRVEVSLSEALRAQANPDDALFVYARAQEGPPMPLAVHRARVRDLPLSVTLDDSQALRPELKMSKFSQVRIGARIAPSGNASPHPGDLEGEVGPLTPGATEPARVIIDRVRP